MHVTILTISLLIGFCDESRVDEPARAQSSEEQYRLLKAELKDAVKSWESKSVEERRVLPWPPDLFGKRFLELAKQHPKSPTAFESLQWIITSEAPEAVEAIEILGHDFTLRPEICLACPDLVSYPHLEKAGELLRRVLDTNPDLSTQGIACLSLARFLKEKSRIVRELKASPDAEKHSQAIEKSFGSDFLKRLNQSDPDRLLEESDSLFERTIAKYGDVKIEEKSLDEIATAELFERRVLVIGKAAPEIDGRDLEGKPLRLSDHRGKVVVLDFWSHEFCGACRQMYPHQRELVRRLADKPFVMLGINNDTDRIKIKAAMEKENLTWRAWWDPGDPFGPISDRWNVRSWPTVYVIDHKGIIRFKNIIGDELDRAVEGLIREQEAEARSQKVRESKGGIPKL